MRLAVLLLFCSLCAFAQQKKAIYHDETRVIIAVTIDPSPQLGIGHSTRDVASDFDLAGGPWKFDVGFNKIQASAQENTDARTDKTIRELRVQLLQLRAVFITYRDARKAGGITNVATLLPHLDDTFRELDDSLAALYETIKP